MAQCAQRLEYISSEHCVDCGGLQVFLFEQDSQGSWALTQELTPGPAQVAYSSGNQKGRSTDFSAKLAMFKTPAQVWPNIIVAQRSQ